MPNMGIITNTVVTDLGIWEGLLQILCFEFMILVEFRDLAYLTIFRVPKKAWASSLYRENGSSCQELPLFCIVHFVHPSILTPI